MGTAFSLETLMASTREKSYVGYGSRAGNLEELGFEDYKQYLASPLWAGIRHKAMLSYKYRCHLCRAPATEVHHLTYDIATLTVFDRQNLVALCRECHVRIEYNEDEKKRSFLEAVQTFLLLEKSVGAAIRRVRDREGSRLRATCEGCQVMPLDGAKKLCRVCTKREVVARRNASKKLRKANWKIKHNRVVDDKNIPCKGCGQSARRGSDYCRPCEAARGQT
jgi:hypothetical protein